jgi:hypothetical protein
MITNKSNKEVKSTVLKEKRARTESISFRIERSVLDDLREESEQKVESLNVLVNQIFRFYVDSDKPWFEPELLIFQRL